MFKEPFVVTLGLDSTGKANRLLDVHMIPTPPRYDVLQLLRRVVKPELRNEKKVALREGLMA
jgi:hypothetical protein